MVIVHGALTNVQGAVVTRVLSFIKTNVSASMLVIDLPTSCTLGMSSLFSKLWVIWSIDWLSIHWIELKILEADVGN